MSAPLSLEAVNVPISFQPDPMSSVPASPEPLSLERLHLVSLVPVGRKPVLVGELANELRRLIMELAAQSGYRVISVAMAPDRLDTLLELNGLHRPQSVSRELRGLSSLRLMQSFPWLRVKLKSNRLWD